MGLPLKVGSKVMLPPLMPCGEYYYCVHYPQTANKCLTPVYYGRYLGFDRPLHLWGGMLGDCHAFKVFKCRTELQKAFANKGKPTTRKEIQDQLVKAAVVLGLPS